MARGNPATQEFLETLRRQCRVSTSGVESLGEGWIKRQVAGPLERADATGRPTPGGRG